MSRIAIPSVLATLLSMRHFLAALHHPIHCWKLGHCHNGCSAHSTKLVREA